MSPILDLRSDTVTTPTPQMREAMFNAPVGDDVMGEDPTVLKLEEMGAKLFGKEACLLTASGTMSNQCAVLSLTQAGQQVVVHDRSHMYNLEVAAFGRICGVQPRAIPAPGGKFDLDQLAANLVTSAIQTAPTGLVCMENTFDLNQGLVVEKSHIDAVAELVHGRGIPLHMDGARILNAAVALDIDPAALCKEVDAVALCLSKGLACPIGSLLAGPKEMIDKARQMRQMLGGGWRQAGVVAAAGIVALEDWKTLGDDHKKAQKLAKGLKKLGLDISLKQVQTNVIRIGTAPSGLGGADFAARLTGFGVKCKPIEPHAVRMICHKDVGHDDIPTVLAAVENLLSAK